MEDNIYDLKEYKRLLELQQKFDEGLIDGSDLTIEDMKKIISLYQHQIKELDEEIREKTKRIWVGDN